MSTFQKLGLQATSDSQTLRLDQIVRNERLQFRPLDRGTVRRYASVLRSGIQMPPVKVANLNGALVLTDGWHRTEALQSLGLSEIEAIVEHAASPEHAYWLAAKANTEHGLPLKAREHRAAFRAYVRAKQHRSKSGGFKSYREIATELGGARAHTTIRNWMEKDFPGVYRAMGGHDELKGQNDDPAAPDVSLAVVVQEALKKAQAALPAVTEPYERGDIIRMLEVLLSEAKSAPWVPPEERPEEPF